MPTANSGPGNYHQSSFLNHLHFNKVPFKIIFEMNEILKEPLTQLYHHNYFIIRIEEEVYRAKRKGLGLSLIFIDIDFFKMINDNFGHQVGDEVLKQFSMDLKDTVRESDLIFRYGGDEFTIILPEASIDDAIKISQRIKGTVEKQGYGPSGSLRISLSVGISQFPIDSVNPADLIQKADERNLISKRTGRGKIVYKDNVVEESQTISLSSVRMVGREKEIKSFTQLLTEFANSDRRFIAILNGVKGSGITRLIEEISNIAAIVRIKPINVTLVEKDLTDRLALVRSILKELLKDEKEEVTGEYANIFVYPQKETPREDLTVISNEQKLIDTVLELLSKRSKNQKILLTINNGQLISKESMPLLVQILQSSKAKDASLIIAEKGRNGFEKELSSLSEVIHYFEVLPLTREEVKTLLWQILRSEPDENFLDWIMAQTAGRPLYIDKILNILLLSNKLSPAENHWILSDDYYIGVENTFLPLVEEISSLTPQERDVLEVCAVYNISFSCSVIAALTELPVTEIDEIFNSLCTKGYLEEIIPYNLYRFPNQLIKEIVYFQIPKEKRTKMHFKIARMLDNNPEEISRLNPQILYEHYVNGGMEHKAIPHIESMIRNAIKKKEFKKATELIQRIFEIEDNKLQVSEQIGLLRELGMCLKNVGDFDSSFAKLKQALELAQKHGEKYEEALVRLEMTRIQYTNRDEHEFLTNIEQIQQIGSQLNDHRILAKALVDKALYYYDFEKKPTKAILTLDEALDLLKEEEDHELLTRIYGNLGNFYAHLKQYQKAKENFEIALYHARICNNPDYICTIMLNYGVIQSILEDLENSRKTLEKTLEFAKRENIMYLMPHLYSNLAMIYVNYGEYSIAIKYMEKTIDYAKEMDLKVDVTTYETYLYGIRSYLGDQEYYTSKLEEIVEKELHNTEAWERANCYLINNYSFLGKLSNLEKIYKNMSNFRNLMLKNAAEITLYENIIIFSKESKKLIDFIKQKEKESITKADSIGKVNSGTVLYLYHSITGEPTDVTLDEVLELSKNAMDIKSYIDVLLYDQILGTLNPKLLEELKNQSIHFNLKQKLLFYVVELRVELASGETENAHEKIEELERKLIDHKAILVLTFLYRMGINFFKEVDPQFATLLGEKLNLLLTDAFSSYF